MFKSILTDNLTITNILICMISSIILGFIIAYSHMKSKRYSKNFIIALTLLPLLIEVVIIMVNGNLGTSVAILGAFSLIRFRSMPGTSRELLSIFLAMAAGLALGMGQVLFAFTFTFLALIVILILTNTNFGEMKNKSKMLKIIVPENLDYTNIFNDLLNKYCSKYTLTKSKTTNMGSLFELTYKIDIKDIDEKSFIDEIRCRNGNLSISISEELIDNEL